MAFVIQWLWYLLAFLVGSLAAWSVVILAIKQRSEDEAIAALPDSRELGAR